ncbi:MAG: ABC transporter substrate-binding protein [Pseudomonadota bacterium]|nr:ABC transporter substrate-binding protein [Pseudomonadota bacterium]
MKIAAVTLGALALCVLLAPTKQIKADEFSDGARKFIRSVADQAISQLTKKEMSSKEREKKFRLILKNYFDVASIGKWALGRYWRKADNEERKEYLILFENLIVTTYANRFKNYSNENIAINKTVRRGKMALVQSNLERGGQKPIRVDWRVTFPDGQYKIFDIVVEGVSLVQTQRSEFSSVIRRNGGKVSDLIIALRAKTTSSK